MRKPRAGRVLQVTGPWLPMDPRFAWLWYSQQWLPPRGWVCMSMGEDGDFDFEYFYTLSSVLFDPPDHWSQLVLDAEVYRRGMIMGGGVVNLGEVHATLIKPTDFRAQPANREMVALAVTGRFYRGNREGAYDEAQ